MRLPGTLSDPGQSMHGDPFAKRAPPRKLETCVKLHFRAETYNSLIRVSALRIGRAILSCYDKIRGQLQQTIDISDDLLSDAERTQETHLSLAVLMNGVAVALGNRLVLTRADGGLTRVELPGQAVRMFATISNTRRGVAVMLHNGAVMRANVNEDRRMRARVFKTQ